MDLNLLETTLNDQLTVFIQRDPGFPRLINLGKYLKSPQITVISGIRRCGKSTLLKQLSRQLTNFYYLNLDDERLLNFTVMDFNQVLMLWQKMYRSNTILIDEVQNVAAWERFVRRMHDEGYKLFITGSNAKLLSSELATHLTGRYQPLSLYPFSFAEYIGFYHGPKFTDRTTSAQAKLSRFFDRYLRYGGFPEYVRTGDQDYLARVYEDILYRDIIARFGIKEIKALRQLTHFLFTNFTQKISYRSLARVLGFKSVMTVRNYINYLEESFLVFELFRYDYSLKKQYVHDKKIYLVDNGLRSAAAFSFSADQGQYLENTVFTELKRRGKTLYYYHNKAECDFIVMEKGRPAEAIQVTAELKDNKERELQGLNDAMTTLSISRGLILTKYQNEVIKQGRYRLPVRPVWQWLLDNRLTTI